MEVNKSEMAMIGAILYDCDTVYDLVNRAGITPETMGSLQCRRAMEVIDLCMTTTRAADVLIVSERLVPGDSIDALFLLDCVKACVTVTHAEEYIELVRSDFNRRELLAEIAQSQTNLAGGDDPAIVMLSMSELIDRLTHTVESSRSTHQVIEAIKANKASGEGIPTRWRGPNSVGNIFRTYHAGDLITVGGMTSVGKSTFACNEIIHMADTLGIPVALKTFEMREETLYIKLAAEWAGLNAFTFAEGLMAEDEVAMFYEALDHMKTLPIHIDSRPCTAGDLRAWGRRMKRRHGVGLLALDYVQLLRRDKEYRNQSQNDFLEYAGSVLKSEVAEELELPVLCMSQFNRPDDKKERKTTPYRPTLHSFRGSGGIEQSADVCILLCKKPGIDVDEFSKDNDWPIVADVAKQRMGPTGWADMWLVRRLGRIMSPDEHTAYVTNQQIDTLTEQGMLDEAESVRSKQDG